MLKKWLNSRYLHPIILNYLNGQIKSTSLKSNNYLTYKKLTILILLPFVSLIFLSIYIILLNVFIPTIWAPSWGLGQAPTRFCRSFRVTSYAFFKKDASSESSAWDHWSGNLWVWVMVKSSSNLSTWHLIGCSLLCSQSGASLHVDTNPDYDYNS